MYDMSSKFNAFYSDYVVLPKTEKNKLYDKKALRRKTKQFNAEPEVKTSCVRVKYADGYHIDFAVYRRHYDFWNDYWVYEHAGSAWTQRELGGLTDWFTTKNDASDDKLRKVVRLSKMFCKSRTSWKNMPSDCCRLFYVMKNCGISFREKVNPSPSIWRRVCYTLCEFSLIFSLTGKPAMAKSWIIWNNCDIFRK